MASYSNGCQRGFPPLADLVALRQTTDSRRWRAISDVAQVVANYLRCHPKVSEVRYPGLKSDALFQEAAHTLVGGFGPLLWYCVNSEWHTVTCENDDDPHDVIMWLEACLKDV